MRSVFMYIFIAIAMVITFSLTASDESRKVSIIFDTDIGNDCDDAGALAILHAMADKGEVDILGVICSSGANPYGPGAVDAINTYYGRPHLPIGAEQGDFGDPAQKYTQQVGTNTALFGHDIVDKTDVPAALTVYRQLLADAPDNSVTIVTVGHLKGLHDLLFSEADNATKLNGIDLVKKKVKEWVCMGGYYPSGGEFNLVKMGANAYTKDVVDNWPIKVVFSGAEIGNAYRTGSGLANLPENNPVRECYYHWANFYNSSWPFSRRSWDQTAVLYAVRGLSTYWNAQTNGYNSISTSGYNTWQESPDKDHNALINISGSGVGTVIENLMNQPPMNVPTASFTKIVTGLSVKVDGSNSSSPHGSFTSYTWNWGDGSTDTGVTANHTYAETGIYNITLTVANDQGQTASQVSQITAHDGTALNESNPLVNLALAADVTLSGNAGIDGRGKLNHILYDPSIDDYVVKSDWAEYGVASQSNLGKIGLEDAFYWMAEWAAPKNINYITFGGCYPNQPQTKTLWQVEYRFEDHWAVLDSGQGGWLNDGIFSWGGEEQAPIMADAVRARIYSDGLSDLVSIHLCGRGGVTYKASDKDTSPKASVIQFIGNHDTIEPTPSTPNVAFTNTSNNLTVAVDASSSSTPSGTISSYAWNWGDGSTGEGLTASKAYAQAGNYTITLTVTNSEGGVANKSVIITVNNAPSTSEPSNTKDALINLALSADATLSGNAGTDRRGELNHILYDPSIGDYVVKSDWNEYGVAYGVNLGTADANNGFYWMSEWAAPKKINYITFGGCYSNQPQSQTLWRVEYRFNNNWTTIEAGQGGWLTNGIFSWGGVSQAPVTADAVRVRIYSNGVNDIQHIHLRARGGVSKRTNDSGTATKATLIQYLGEEEPSDMLPPQISVQTVTIKGTVQDMEGTVASVTVNGQEVSLNNGIWEYELPLSDVDLPIEVIAVDEAGNSSSKTLSIKQ